MSAVDFWMQAVPLATAGAEADVDDQLQGLARTTDARRERRE